MGLVKAIDDISAGENVTIHSLQPRASRPSRANKAMAIALQQLLPVSPGVPLRVLEVSLPFVACAVIDPGGTESGPVILDVRVVRLCRMSAKFIEAIKAFSDSQAMTAITGQDSSEKAEFQ